jgi:hypothetical protein
MRGNEDKSPKASSLRSLNSYPVVISDSYACDYKCTYNSYLDVSEKDS